MNVDIKHQETKVCICVTKGCLLNLLTTSVIGCARFYAVWQRFSHSQQMPKVMDPECSSCTLIGHTTGPLHWHSLQPVP